MRFLLPKVLALFIAFLMYCGYNTKKQDTLTPTSYVLKVERGGFHNDAFQLIGNSIFYFPDTTDTKPITRYNRSSITKLDEKTVTDFFAYIEKEGVWQLNKTYHTKSSCTSGLRITIEQNGRKKTIVCDDFRSNCPPLLKYIDQKVVELEGNDLKWTFLPG